VVVCYLDLKVLLLMIVAMMSTADLDAEPARALLMLDEMAPGSWLGGSVAGRECADSGFVWLLAGAM